MESTPLFSLAKQCWCHESVTALVPKAKTPPRQKKKTAIFPTRCPGSATLFLSDSLYNLVCRGTNILDPSASHFPWVLCAFYDPQREHSKTGSVSTKITSTITSRCRTTPHPLQRFAKSAPICLSELSRAMFRTKSLGT